MGSQLFGNLQKASSTLESKMQLRNSVVEVSLFFQKEQGHGWSY